MIFHISLIHQIKNLFIQSPKKPSSVEKTHQNGMIVFTRLIQFGHKFAQEITVYIGQKKNEDSTTKKPTNLQYKMK